tara:strand:+ start:138 stop:452 length:315 start_codon:yes stop_codon:yes gene_type:complete
MKEIKAFIRPEKLTKLAEHLKKENFGGFTIFEGEGAGNYSDPKTTFPSLKHPFLHNKIIKIELVCKKEKVAEIVKIIKEYAQTGESGDGLIYVVNVEQKIRIRD